MTKKKQIDVNKKLKPIELDTILFANNKNLEATYVVNRIGIVYINNILVTYTQSIFQGIDTLMLRDIYDKLYDARLYRSKKNGKV